MAIEKVRLETNVPQVFALQFTKGETVEGNFGPQVRYKLADGRTWYAPVVVANKVDRLHLATAESFRVCKRERYDDEKKRNSTIYEVERYETAVATATQQQPVPQRTPALRNETAEPITNATQHTQDNATERPMREYTELARRYMKCFQGALDVAQAVAPYAAKRNCPLVFTQEDIRAMATTLFIEGQKGAR